MSGVNKKNHWCRENPSVTSSKVIDENLASEVSFPERIAARPTSA